MSNMNPLQPLVNNLMTVQRQLVGGLRHNGDIPLDEFAAKELNNFMAFIQTLTYASFGALSVTGYLGSHVVDTNDNPSNLKTLLTIFGSNIVGSGLAAGVTSVTSSYRPWKQGTDNFAKALDFILRTTDGEVTRFNEKADEQKKAMRSMPGKKRELDRIDLFNSLNADGQKALTAARNQIKTLIKIASGVMLVTAGANAYHGYKRNGDSLGYGLAWLFAGPTGLGVAVQQGFGKSVVAERGVKRELLQEDERISQLESQVQTLGLLQAADLIGS